MTQYSYPWPGTAPGDGVDGGPYSAADWWGRIVALLSTGGVVDPTVPLLPAAGRYNLGVLHDIGNDLAVANPANNDITIATGAAVVDGAVHFNDAAITLEIPLPSVNPRIDRIVIRKNYTSSQYDPAGDAGVEEVPAYTARITRIVGTEAAAPAAPALVQSTGRTTYWDVPLAQFQISTAGVITALVDQREFAPLWDTENIADEAITTDKLAQRTRTVFVVPPNATKSVETYAYCAGLDLIYGEDDPIPVATILVPDNYVSDMELQPVFTLDLAASPSAEYYVRFSTRIGCGPCGGSRVEEDSGNITTTVNIEGYEGFAIVCVSAIDVETYFTPEPDEFISLRTQREDILEEDPLYAKRWTGTIFFMGWIMTYTAAN